MSDTLEQVLADEREEAAVLRRNGHAQEAANRERILDRIQAAAEPFLRFHAEGDAMMFSGRARAWLRQRFAAWAAMGHARRIGGVREYRECVLPHRTPESIAREAGRRGERGPAQSAQSAQRAS